MEYAVNQYSTQKKHCAWFCLPACCRRIVWCYDFKVIFHFFFWLFDWLIWCQKSVLVCASSNQNKTYRKYESISCATENMNPWRHDINTTQFRQRRRERAINERIQWYQKHKANTAVCQKYDKWKPNFFECIYQSLGWNGRITRRSWAENRPMITLNWCWFRYLIEPQRSKEKTDTLIQSSAIRK